MEEAKPSKPQKVEEDYDPSKEGHDVSVLVCDVDLGLVCCGPENERPRWCWHGLASNTETSSRRGTVPACCPLLEQRGLCAVASTRSAWVVRKGPASRGGCPSQVVHEASWLCRNVTEFGAANGGPGLSLAQGLVEFVLAQIWLGGCAMGSATRGIRRALVGHAMAASAGRRLLPALAMLADSMQHPG